LGGVGRNHSSGRWQFAINRLPNPLDQEKPRKKNRTARISLEICGSGSLNSSDLAGIDQASGRLLDFLVTRPRHRKEEETTGAALVADSGSRG
jgi:hypothetical protein